ncbi:class I SAM-dependent methyltransferase [Nocardia arthritidis]|uniref:Class I SAM-dependent methyltransferase n=1 Tax=Nocardia arthritidis TaxID=228602 RepID=A0A6G9YKE9_9NOCA|nr:class I SAM-dependent methyltransferase [Nocardia arthritidis]QIS13630.1 class I SAM-dependent methyltransferase [Nocardia arthritidis]
MAIDAARLGEVQETLLIPLYGRAVETGKSRPILRDPKAVEMVRAIDYDFGRFDGGRSLFGTVLRTSIIDAWVLDFLERHPDGTVVEIGAGLNTRFERVDNGRLHWVDLDLPDAMALRSEFFAESDRRRMLAASVLDDSWIEPVKTLPGPYFFISEGVLVYLEEAQVRRALTLIAENFRGADLAMDTTGRWMIDHQDNHDALGKVSARMRWACDDPAEVEGWAPGWRLLASGDLSRLPARMRDRMPLPQRIGLRAASLIFRQRFGHYRLNHYRA